MCVCAYFSVWISLFKSYYKLPYAHDVWQEGGVDLVTVIKGAGFYRRGKYIDYVSDYMPPTPSEFKKIHESSR